MSPRLCDGPRKAGSLATFLAKAKLQSVVAQELRVSPTQCGKDPNFCGKEARILLRKDWHRTANGALLIRPGAQNAPGSRPRRRNRLGGVEAVRRIASL